ncbi:SLOG cluster 4 domain-containing protein [Georgenia muralis]
MISPDLPVVAIFGTNDATPDELAAAELLGAAVHRSAAVLLTGGDLKPRRPRHVKDAAVFAAHGAASRDRPARWIGVANKVTAAPARWRGAEAVVLTPGWGHRRNFVEACLCDAAIAIGGASPGTSSEALFSLFLGRPLVVVGGDDTGPRTVRQLVPLAEQKIRRPSRPALAVDRGIAGAYAWADDVDVALDLRALPTRAASASDLLVEVLRRADRRAPRPELGRLVDETAWDGVVATALRDAGRDAG